MSNNNSDYLDQNENPTNNQTEINNIINSPYNANNISNNQTFFQSNVIPTNSNVNNSFSYNNQNNIENIVNEKASLILNQLNKIIEKLKIDPILCSMKKEPMLFEFYKSRILEIVSEKLTNIQEKKITNIEKENMRLNNELTTMNNKYNEIQKFFLDEKEKILINIQNLEKELNIKTEQNTKLFEQIESMTSEINAKNQEIIYYQNNVENIKIKQDEMKNYLNDVVEQNIKLANDNKQFLAQIEKLKLDYDSNIQNLNKKILELKNENENILKVKIIALRNKLREKINIINKLTNTNEVDKNE